MYLSKRHIEWFLTVFTITGAALTIDAVTDAMLNLRALGILL